MPATPSTSKLTVISPAKPGARSGKASTVAPSSPPSTTEGAAEIERVSAIVTSDTLNWSVVVEGDPPWLNHKV